MMLCLAGVLAMPALAAAHGNMLYPPAWWDANGTSTVVAPGNICYTGCGGKTENCFPACMWFSDFTLLEAGTTETITGDSPLRTYMDINIKPIDPDPKVPDAPIDIYGMHPWHHPGRAPVWSPCGIGGGNPRGCFIPGTNTPRKCPEGASQNGPDARYFPFPDVKTTVWKQGGVAETAWNVVANHGGGYSYRLCPLQTATQPPGYPLDETCFQAHALEFEGDTQWFQFGSNRSSRAMYGPIKAMRTSEGTWPEGSQWTRNPVPACHGPGAANGYGRGGGNQKSFPNKGGAHSCSKESYRCPPKSMNDPSPSAPCDPKKGNTSEFAWDGIYEGPQFPPVGGYPGKYASEGIYTYGFGNNQGQDNPTIDVGGSFLFSIIDLVKVPEDIPEGLYALSHRYDCEQTTQVWNTCSNVLILDKNNTTPDEMLIPDGPSGLDAIDRIMENLDKY